MDIIQLSQRLIEDGYKQNATLPTPEELKKWQEFAKNHDLRDAEGWFLPEHWYYADVIENVDENDVVLDVCAGNLALDLILSRICKKVYAVEVNPEVLSRALEIIGLDLPRNLIVVCCNALDFPVPQDVNTVILLNIHWKHPIPIEWIEGKKFITSIGGEIAVLESPVPLNVDILADQLVKTLDFSLKDAYDLLRRLGLENKM